ncbi:AzlD domain-containing protein [Streptomyces sp. NPDC057702]|uniref:AzlD domain-containing protein n=1 Tax=unclassified Streptomyces TaxID=2593676 RepID=UPI00367985FD
MTDPTWLVLIALAATTFLLKGAGSLVMGDRALPAWFPRFVEYLTPALLCVLVVTQLLGRPDGDGLAVDARVTGFAAALVAGRLKAPVPLVVLVAAATTAAARALT